MKFAITENGNFGIDTILSIYPAIKNHALKNKVEVRLIVEGTDIYVESPILRCPANSKDKQSITTLIEKLNGEKIIKTDLDAPIPVIDILSFDEFSYLQEKSDIELRELSEKIANAKSLKKPGGAAKREKLIEFIKANA
jgi:hypothetical protein